MRRATPLVIALVSVATWALTGCGGGNERLYYQTRAIPTDVESSYGSVQRQQWQGDPSVYELPAAAPAYEDEHRARRTCVLPGPRFKSPPIVGVHEDVRGSSDPTIQPAGGYDHRPQPLGPIGPGDAQIAGRLGDAPPAGLTQHSHWQTVGDWDSRNAPNRGSDVIPPTPMGASRDPAPEDYCLPGETPSARARSDAR
jgi:hypothetical protein